MTLGTAAHPEAAPLAAGCCLLRASPHTATLHMSFYDVQDRRKVLGSTASKIYSSLHGRAMAPTARPRMTNSELFGGFF